MSARAATSPWPTAGFAVLVLVAVALWLAVRDGGEQVPQPTLSTQLARACAGHEGVRQVESNLSVVVCLDGTVREWAR